jgi:hypothetical protein
LKGEIADIGAPRLAGNLRLVPSAQWRSKIFYATRPVHAER